MIPYPILIESLRLSKVPAPIVGMHLRFGIIAGQTCGDCESWRELWVNGVHHYCARCWSTAELAPGVVACGKFRADDARRRRDAARPTQLALAPPHPDAAPAAGEGARGMGGEEA